MIKSISTHNHYTGIIRDTRETGYTVRQGVQAMEDVDEEKRKIYKDFMMAAAIDAYYMII